MADAKELPAVYQLVIDDEVGMVLAQADTLRELCTETGINALTIASAVARRAPLLYKNKPVRIIRVRLDNEEGLTDG